MVDPETLTLLGEIPGGHQDALILPLAAAKRVIFLTPNSTGFLLIYDLETLRLVGSAPFPVPRGAGSGLVAWGVKGLAFHDGVRLVLLESELLPSDPAADLEVQLLKLLPCSDGPAGFNVRAQGKHREGIGANAQFDVVFAWLN